MGTFIATFWNQGWQPNGAFKLPSSYTIWWQIYFVKPCRLFATKPLPKPMMASFQSHPKEKLQWKNIEIGPLGDVVVILKM